MRLVKDIDIVRMLFRFAFESGLKVTPARFGPEFKTPSKKNLRKAKRTNGRKDFAAEEIRRILAAAPPCRCV